MCKISLTEIHLTVHKVHLASKLWGNFIDTKEKKINWEMKTPFKCIFMYFLQSGYLRLFLIMYASLFSIIYGIYKQRWQIYADKDWTESVMQPAWALKVQYVRTEGRKEIRSKDGVQNKHSCKKCLRRLKTFTGILRCLYDPSHTGWGYSM